MGLSSTGFQKLTSDGLMLSVGPHRADDLYVGEWPARGVVLDGGRQRVCQGAKCLALVARWTAASKELAQVLEDVSVVSCNGLTSSNCGRGDSGRRHNNGTNAAGAATMWIYTATGSTLR